MLRLHMRRYNQVTFYWSSFQPRSFSLLHVVREQTVSYRANAIERENVIRIPTIDKYMIA